MHYGTVSPNLSTLRRAFSRNMWQLFFVFCCVVFATGQVDAQTARQLDLRITLHPSAARATIEARLPEPTNRWSFLQQYAGVANLGERVTNFATLDDAGQTIACQKLSPGTYAAERPASMLRIEINLTAPARDVDAAHVSWLSGERALLMLGDLVPISAAPVSAIVELALPAEWAVFSTAPQRADKRFAVADPEKAIFAVGRDLRYHAERISGVDLTLVTAGDWPFAPAEAMKTTSAVLKEQQMLFDGAPPAERALVVLTTFPSRVRAQRWSAETRGSTIVLLQEPANSATADLALLGTNLAHELLHLWLPNGLRLKGSYDWFYEGFTLYQAMRSGMRLQYLTFADYLSAIGRAYDAYTQTSQKFGDYSLLEASRRRWSGHEIDVYNKGLLVALLCDLKLRTSQRRSLDAVYADLYRRFGQTASPSADGNQAVIEALHRAGDLSALTRSYIETNTKIDLASELAPFGLSVSQIGARWVIGVAPQLTETQQKLLRQLGYNAPGKQDRQRRERLKREIIQQ